MCVCAWEKELKRHSRHDSLVLKSNVFKTKYACKQEYYLWRKREHTHTHRTQHFSKQFLLINIIKILSQFSLLHSACCMLCCLSSFLILTKHRRHWQQQPKCLICFVTFWLLPMLHNNNKNYQAAKSLMMIINEKFASSHCMR